MADQSQSSVSLRHYAEILWRRKWLVVETALIIPAIVIGISLTQPNKYAATARWTVPDTDGSARRPTRRRPRGRAVCPAGR